MKKNLRTGLIAIITLILTSSLSSCTIETICKNSGIENNLLSGKTVSILGDSISTYKGISDNGNVNNTITDCYLARYSDMTDSDISLIKFNSVNDTYWMKAINHYNMTLLVNNLWRGTKVLDTPDKAGYQNRCQNLHDNTLENNLNNEIINPDIIAVYLGTNDYLFDTPIGSFEYLSIPDYIIENGDGTFSYEYMPSTFAQAYTIMIHKITQQYPDADVFCFTLYPITYKAEKAAMESYNAVIKQVADHFAASTVDLYADSGITWDNASIYLAQDGLHPNEIGMDKIADTFESALGKKYSFVKYYKK